jgi:hypothetical protein
MRSGPGWNDVGGEGAPYLTAALEDTLICMHARDALGIRTRRSSGYVLTAVRCHGGVPPAELDAASLTLQIVTERGDKRAPGAGCPDPRAVGADHRSPGASGSPAAP